MCKLTTENKQNTNRDFDALMREKAPSQAFAVLAALSQFGYEAFLVGGCVRDVLSGRSPHDWDITTSATPDEMKAAVPFHSVDTGLEHGTITFMVDGAPIETTTFRIDGEYSDGRRPDSVSFAKTVEDDLSRRDFTVNAMAWNLERGLVDPFGGQADLSAGVLRAVGDPRDRFHEDGLRILRAARFAAVLGCEVEYNTDKAMRSCTEDGMLDCVAAERKTSEILKMLSAADGSHLAGIVRDNFFVLSAAYPALAELTGLDNQDNSNHDRSLLDHSIDTMSSLPPDPVLRLAGLLHDIGKPGSQSVGEDGQSHYYGHMEYGAALAEKLCREMKLGNVERERVVALVEKHDLRPRETVKSARRFIVRCGSEEAVGDMLLLMEADIKAHSPEAIDRVLPRFSEARRLVLEQMEAQAEMSVKDLAVSGRDLMEIGFSPSPALGATLEEMFRLVVGEELANDRDALMEYAREVLSEMEDCKRELAKGGKYFVWSDGIPVLDEEAEK